MGILLRATPLRAYGIGLILTLLAFLLTLAAWPLLHTIPLILFFVTVALSAWYGGLGPGLFATALALILSALFILPPAGAVAERLADLGRLGLFSLVGTLLSALIDYRLGAGTQLLTHVGQSRQLTTRPLTTQPASVGQVIPAHITSLRASGIARRRTGEE